MRLTQNQARRLADALCAAFDFETLNVMLQSRLGKTVAALSQPGRFDAVVWNVISVYQQCNESELLVNAAHDARPAVDEIRDLAAEVLAPAADWTELQRWLNAQVPDIDPAIWRRKEERLENATCAIRYPFLGQTAVGTGALIGPDLVLTAAHVLQGVLDGTVAPQSVSFRFDYKKLVEDGPAIEGVTYSLAKDDWRPFVDMKLDAAVVRLNAAAAEEPVGSRSARDGEKRGCIAVPRDGVAYVEGAPLLLLHHPRGEELKLQIDMHSIERVDGNGTRLLHRTNTDGGSSGAPCFDAHLTLIGVHRGTKRAQELNEAVLITAIAPFLRREGLIA